MPKRSYALASDGPLRLEVEWEGGLYRIDENIRLRLDGALIGSAATREELKRGFRVEAGDGSVIDVQLKGTYTLEITYNGIPLNRMLHPQRTFKAISSELWLFAGICAVGMVLSYLDVFSDHAPIAVLTIFLVLLLLFGVLARRSFKLVAMIGAFLPLLFILFLDAVDGFRSCGILELLYFFFRVIPTLRELWRLFKD